LKAGIASARQQLVRARADAASKDDVGGGRQFQVPAIITLVVNNAGRYY
jgi:hypothetical protein